MKISRSSIDVYEREPVYEYWCCRPPASLPNEESIFFYQRVRKDTDVVLISRFPLLYAYRLGNLLLISIFPIVHCSFSKSHPMMILIFEISVMQAGSIR